MSQISLPSLQARSGLSRRHLQRLAADGSIPGATRTASGHWKIESAQVEGWLATRQFARIRRQTLSRNASRDAAKRVELSARHLHNQLVMLYEACEAKGMPVPADVLPLLEKTHMTIAAVLDYAATKSAAGSI